MIQSSSRQNYLSMAIYTAFIHISETQSENPSLDLQAAITLIRSTNHDACALDFERAECLMRESPVKLQGTEPDEQLRNFLMTCIRWEQPWWLRLAPYGREKLRSALDQDQIQCLKNAGLFDAEPGPEVVNWWDQLASLVRGSVDSENMISARKAERLSLEHERRRLNALGIDKEPIWVALNDNTLGYDILSYDREQERIVSRLVEVKSTKSDAVFVTRNEWNNALTAGAKYIFHVWKMPEQHMDEFQSKTMSAHIPTDRGSGIWQNVQIAIL